MKRSVEIERRAQRAMRIAQRYGVNPYDSAEAQGHVYVRLWCDDDRRKRRKAWTISDAQNIWDIEGEGE